MVGFDFHAMQALQKDTQNRDNKRHQRAEKSLHKAIEFLNQFQNNPSPELLAEIKKNTLESVKYKSNQPGPYVMLSYLYYCYADLKNSVQYLKQAEKIDAKAPEVQKRMKQMIEEILEKPPEPSNVKIQTNFKRPQTNEDYDKLYDDTQNDTGTGAPDHE